MNPLHLISYFFWLSWEILVAGWAVAKSTLTGGKDTHPVILHYPMRVTSEFQITALAASITVTPATLSLTIDEDMLLVHAVFGQDHKDLFESIALMEEKLAPHVKGLAHPAPWFVEDPAPAPELLAHRNFDKAFDPDQAFTDASALEGSQGRAAEGREQ